MMIRVAISLLHSLPRNVNANIVIKRSGGTCVISTEWCGLSAIGRMHQEEV